MKHWLLAVGLALPLSAAVAQNVVRVSAYAQSGNARAYSSATVYVPPGYGYRATATAYAASGYGYNVASTRVTVQTYRPYGYTYSGGATTVRIYGYGR